jgi:F0F1-type ATP synthase assembly protein I
MGHSVHPIASTSAAACSAAMFAAANRAAVVCSVERRGGFRSTCPTRCFMIFICSSQQQQPEDELHYLITQTAAEARERRN